MRRAFLCLTIIWRDTISKIVCAMAIALRLKALFLVVCVAIALATTQGAEQNDDSTLALFKKMDTNNDKFLSKKEFYYALMEDEFETLATKHAVPSLELEFEVQDLDHDRKISIPEWKSIFTPQNTESHSDFIKQEIEKSEQAARAQKDKDKTKPTSKASPPPPPPPPSPPPSPAKPTASQRGSAISTPPVPNAMHVGAELVMPDNRTFYLADDATWLEVEEFCKKRAIRLCRYEELCPEIVNHISAEDKDDRWVPVEGPAHKWMELSNCGMTIWPDSIKHRGLIACCEDKPAAPQPPPSAPLGAAPADDAAADRAANATAEPAAAAAAAGAARNQTKAKKGKKVKKEEL